MHLEQTVVVAVGMVMFCMDYCVVGLQRRVGGSMAYVVCHKSHVTESMVPVGLASQCIGRRHHVAA